MTIKLENSEVLNKIINSFKDMETHQIIENMLCQYYKEKEESRKENYTQDPAQATPAQATPAQATPTYAYQPKLSYYEQQYVDKVRELQNQLEILNRAYCYNTNLLGESSLYRLLPELLIEAESDEAFVKGYEKGKSDCLQQIKQTVRNLE